jgi:hypothetical protein
VEDERTLHTYKQADRRVLVLCNLDRLSAMLDHGATAEEMTDMGYKQFTGKETFLPAVDEKPIADMEDEMELAGDATADDKGGRDPAQAGSSTRKGKAKTKDQGKGKGKQAQGGGAFRSSSRRKRAARLINKPVIDTDTDGDDDLEVDADIDDDDDFQ